MLIDTNILIELQKNNPAIVQHLHGLGFGNFAISTITVGEMLVGALNKSDLQQIQRQLRGLPKLPLEPRIGELATDLLASYTLSHRLHLADALIAATAMHHGIPLYTLSLKDFRYITGLALYEPV